MEETKKIPDLSMFLNKNPKVIAQSTPRKSEKIKRNQINPQTGKKNKYTINE